jgi:hypothetical protein
MPRDYWSLEQILAEEEVMQATAYTDLDQATHLVDGLPGGAEQVLVRISFSRLHTQIWISLSRLDSRGSGTSTGEDIAQTDLDFVDGPGLPGGGAEQVLVSSLPY